MQQQISAILSVTDIFDNLTRTQLELVASISKPVVCQSGDVIIHENERTNSMFVIVRGVVEILVTPGFVGHGQAADDSELTLLTELRQGQVVGEVSLVDQGVRSATARAAQENTELLKIERYRLMRLCDTYPDLGYKIMKNLAADLAFKIRNTDLTVRQYQLMLSQQQEK